MVWIGCLPPAVLRPNAERSTGRKKFEAATKPLFELLYRDVQQGVETRRVLETCGAPDYREKLTNELDIWKNSEMWKTGAAVRGLRPENWKKK